MTSASLVQLIEAAAAVCVAGRILRLGLAGRQPGLFAFLVFNALYLLALSSVLTGSPQYFWLYVGGASPYWMVSVYAVREMFVLAMGEYPGIQTAARWSMYASIALAAVVSLLVADVSWRSDFRSNLYYVEVINRSFFFTLAVVIVSLLFFLSRYPLRLPVNTYLSTGCFAVVFLSEAAEMLVDSIKPALEIYYADRIQGLFAAACFLFWAVALRPERVGVTRIVSFNSPHEHELLQELESLNRVLTRAGRR